MSGKLEISGTPGEIYEQHMVPATFARWAPELVEAADVRLGERVLDVACGTGAVTRILVDRVGQTGRVVGLDFNAGMLAAARRCCEFHDRVAGGKRREHVAAGRGFRCGGVSTGAPVLS